MQWHDTSHDELSALLAQLREVQDSTTTTAGPPLGTTAAQQAQQFLASLSNPDPSVQIPSQSQLTSLLDSLVSPVSPKLDFTQMSFAEALPVLQSLYANNEEVEVGGDRFLDVLADLKSQQEDEELRMKDERNRLAAELGRGGISPHVQLQKLKDWDRQALVRWKQLQDSQREVLQDLGVPTFCQTKDPLLLKRQQRVMAVLAGFLDD